MGAAWWSIGNPYPEDTARIVSSRQPQRRLRTVGEARCCKSGQPVMDELANLSDSSRPSQYPSSGRVSAARWSRGNMTGKLLETRVAKGANESNIDSAIRRCAVSLNRNNPIRKTVIIRRVLWGFPAKDESESMPWSGSHTWDLTLGPSSPRTGVPRSWRLVHARQPWKGGFPWRIPSKQREE